MNASKVTITNETMDKKITNKQKGKLRMDRLREVSKSGKLAFAKNRNDVAEMVGYLPGQNGGYQWVLYNIQKGVLKEEIVKYNNYGRAEYFYTFNDPEEKNEKKTEKIAAEQPQIIISDEEKPIVITIYKGETTITFENISSDVVSDILKSILK